jgi:hypothetical protein
MTTPRFTPPSGPGGRAPQRDRGSRLVSRRMRGVVALAVAGTVGVGALAAQHSLHATTSASTSATAATATASSATTTSSTASLQSATSTPTSSASQTPVAASGGS